MGADSGVSESEDHFEATDLETDDSFTSSEFGDPHHKQGWPELVKNIFSGNRTALLLECVP